MSAAARGPRVGRPAPALVVASYFAAALAAWLAAAVVLALASRDLAAGSVAAGDVLLAVHLVALGFLPLAVTGGVLHVLPTLLRNDASRWRGPLALPLLCAGPLLAVGIARDLDALVRSAAVAETLGFLLVAWELAVYVARAPSGRMLLASRVGIALSTLHAAAALAIGGALAERGFRPLWGIPHDRAIAVHLHLAALGWLTLLLVAVGRTLGPMLALAPAAPRRRAPVAEIALAAGTWLVVAGLARASRPLELAGAAIVVAALTSFVTLVARVTREYRVAVPEGPLVHLAAGLFFLAEAAALGIGMAAGADVTSRRLVAYALLLLVGWAAGATLGHAVKLLSLSVWAWWPPGPRPKQGDLYSTRLAIAEAAGFALAVELVAVGVIGGSTAAVAAGGALLVGSALAACAGAAVTLCAGGAALRRLS